MTVQDNNTTRVAGNSANLPLAQITGYLAAKGWRLQEQSPLQVWTHTDEIGVISEIRLAADSGNPDFPRQVSDMLHQLAQIEGRDQALISAEIAHADADTVQVDLRSTETADHALVLENSVRLMQGLQRLIGAAAWATLEPAPYLTGKKPPQIGQYMRTVRVQPASLEGYGQAITSPLRELDQETFSHRALLTLANSLDKLSQVATNTVQIADREKQRELIETGVTANLCESLALMFGKPATPTKKRSKRGVNAEHTLTIGFSWSPMVAVPQETPASITFDAEMIPIFQDLADLLRETSPQEDFQFQGLVTDLKRTGQSGLGKIVVNNATRTEPEKVAMELEDDLYELAIQAHKEKVPVLCIGTLIKNNKSFELVNASLAMLETQRTL